MPEFATGIIRKTPDQVAVDSDRAFCAHASDISPGLGDGELFLLKAVKLPLRIHKIYANSNQAFDWSLHFDPTITLDGTPLTVASRLLGSATTADALAFSVPTIAARGNTLIGFQHVTKDSFVELRFDGEYILLPGHSLYFRGTTLPLPRTASVSLVWEEIRD